MNVNRNETGNNLPDIWSSHTTNIPYKRESSKSLHDDKIIHNMAIYFTTNVNLTFEIVENAA